MSNVCSRLTKTILQGLCQQVLQPWLSLEAASEEGRVNLKEAIHYSLSTPGAFLHNLLQVSSTRSA